MRKSGILMHISSLPSPYGIGTLGKSAYEFADFLANSSMKYWQILPVCPTGLGDSPYMSVCCFAGNPYFIDLDILCEQQLISRDEINSFDFGQDATKVCYEKISENRPKILALAYSRFNINNIDYIEFCKENSFWLDDYALFCAIKDYKQGLELALWEDSIRLREQSALDEYKTKLSKEIEYYKFVQYLFFSQWYDLKKYCDKNDVKIIGDMPIYVSPDSADFWAHSDCFMTDKDCRLSLVAGVPPDGFCKDGQLWGNPVYDWKELSENNYYWWVERFLQSNKLFDRIRVDHFRAFEAFYAVDTEIKDAKKGKWYKGPGVGFFDYIKKVIPDIDLIAEDLGYITPELAEFLNECGFPGMNVLQFAFSPDGDSVYLPYKHKKNSVVYTGTHDNDTILGWMNSGNSEEVEYAKQFLRLNESEGYNWGFMKAALASRADTCILTIQDIIGLDSSARMNTPSVPSGNWRWRILPGCTNDWLAQILLKFNKLYNRD